MTAKRGPDDRSRSTRNEQPPERLQKVLARAGVGSRRQVDAWVEEGRVTVNGDTAIPGQKVGLGDEVRVDGRVIGIENAHAPVRRVLMYNKPEGEVTTRSDPEGRPTVFDGLPSLQDQRWIAVGRLDLTTSGLLLFTTDGELANRLMHPSQEVDREYAVRVFGDVDDDMIQRLLDGVLLDDGMARFSDVQPAGGSGINRWFHVVLFEGRNREVRRLWESQGVQVSRLKRVRFGPAFLPSRLPVGRWEELDQKGVDALSRKVGLEPLKIPAQTPQEKAHQRRRQRKRPGKPAGSGLKKGQVTTRPPRRQPARKKGNIKRGR